MLELLAAADQLLTSIDIPACNAAGDRVLTWMPPSWSCWLQLMGKRARHTWPSWGRARPWPSARCWAVGEHEIALFVPYPAQLGTSPFGQVLGREWMRYVPAWLPCKVYLVQPGAVCTAILQVTSHNVGQCSPALAVHLSSTMYGCSVVPASGQI